MNWRRIAPDGTFIGEYMKSCAALETPHAYDFWGAVWTLGSLLGRGVYVPRPHAPVYMNWYILLVAESGVTRKSTAVRIARDTVIDFDGPDSVIGGRATPEFLFTRLNQNPRMYINVSELVTFLGRESYIIELPAFLTDLYDCPRTLHGGTVTRGATSIASPYVTFLSASTPSWLRSAVNPSVVEGGFTSRCLFIHDERPKAKVPWPDDAGHDNDAITALLSATLDRATAVGTIELLPGARKRFDTWYKRRDTTSVVPFVASFNSREDAHVLRMAAILAINDGTLAIDRRHIDAAIKLIMQAKAGAVAMFQDGGTSLKIAQGIDRATQILLEAGPIGVPHTQLYASCRHYVNRDEFAILMATMHELGMIVKMVEKKARGRQGVRYVRDNRMTNAAAMDKLLQTFV